MAEEPAPVSGEGEAILEEGEGTLSPPLSWLMDEAARVRATDVHIDPVANGFVVRKRIDGVLGPRLEYTRGQGQRILNQLKVACGMDLEWSRAAREGHFHFSTDHKPQEVRATVIPTKRTEAAHLRLLHAPGPRWDLEHLGMGVDQALEVRETLESPHGLAVVAGQTGSGKTTTMYALTQTQDLWQRIAASIEDPVEFDVDYVRQIEVDHRVGHTMEDGLRTLLRMDPDILLIGEARDRTSAVTAARAGLAGRLVLTTVHARDAAAAVEALHYMGVPYYILGGALRVVVAQDLVRRICPHCAESRSPAEHERRIFREQWMDPPEKVMEPVGCDACHLGYRGRCGLFEIATIDEGTARWLAAGRRQQEIRDRFTENGMRPILSDALHKAAAGITSMQEVLGFVDKIVQNHHHSTESIEP